LSFLFSCFFFFPCRPIFEAHTTVIDPELQQRALEYLHLPKVPETVLSTVLDAMPPFPERQSMLEARLKKAAEEKEDKDVWGKEDGGAGGASKESRAGEEGGDDEGGRRGSKASVGGLPGDSASGGGGGADDLLGLGGGSAAAAPAVDAASVPVTTRVGLDAASGGQGQVVSWFNSLLVGGKPSGVLYEDPHIQIGAKSAFNGADGKITLFIGNKSTTNPLVTFKLRVVPPSSAPSAVKIETGDIPSTVGVKAQVQVPITLESLQPFTEANGLALQISFISQPGTGHVYPLRLPVGLHLFCDPIAMQGEDYRTRWKALAGAPKEVTAVITPAAGDSAVNMANATTALERIRMSPVDAGAPGATGASSFRTKSVNASGALISVGCLAMIIPAAPVYKVAVRTQHPDVSQALMNALQTYLEGCT
jgi:AP-2 complex subunit alpha